MKKNPSVIVPKGERKMRPRRGIGECCDILRKLIIIIRLYGYTIYTQNYKWQNGKQYKGKTNSWQSALARRVRQGCTGPCPSLTPLPNRVAVKQDCQNFAKHKILTKLFWILRNWRTILRNTKLKISQKFREITYSLLKNKIDGVVLILFKEVFQSLSLKGQ